MGLALVSVTVACGDSGGPGTNDCPLFGLTGSFEADLTGAVTTHIAGCAGYNPVTGPPAGTNVLLIATVAPGYSMVLGRAGQPTPGTYPVQSAELPTAEFFIGSIRVGQTPGTDREFSFTSGSVTISGFDATTRAYDASFTVTGSRSVAGQVVETVTVSGTFSARCRSSDC